MNFTLLRLRRILAASIGLLVILTCIQIASAQETRGTIRGTVTDPNGQAVANATVQVTDPTRGSTVTLTTNSEGFYQVLYLLPGSYQVVVEATGFKKSIRDNLVLQISQTLQVNVPLEIGGAQETVTVTTDIPPLNTENASLGQVVDSQRINELPTPHGDPYSLIGLSNGVAFTGDPRLDRPFEPTHIVGYAINGVRGNRMDLTIDGVASTATADANQITASYVPPSDVIQEFKVQTATFDAQFGNTEGAVTSILIKSGSNGLHGSAYFNTEPGQLAANDTFGKARGQERPNSYSYRYGGYVSGPIWKDKTFYLFGIESIKDARPRFDVTNNGGSAWIPTAALASGDFSQFICAPGVNTPAAQQNPNNCTNIFNPLTLTSGSSGTAQQFSDPTRATATNPLGLNIIPANLISPVAKAFMTFMGQPKNQGLVGNINDSTLLETTSPYYNWTFRVDHQLTENNHLFVRGSWYYRNGLYNRYTDSPYDGQAFAFKSRGGVIDDVHTFNSTTFLNIKYGYNRFVRWQQSQPDAIGFDLTNLWGSTQGALYNDKIAEAIRRFPAIQFPSNTVLASGQPTNEIRPNDSHNFAAILNKSWGKHSFKFGAELRIYREDSSFENSDQTGRFVFDQTYTRRASSDTNDPVGLKAFAAFLLGLPSTQSITRRADYSEYSKTWGFFVQDDFHVGRNLTINAGLRYEKEQALRERQDKSVSGFDFGFVQPAQAAVRTNIAANQATFTDLTGTPIPASSFNVTGGLTFADENSGKLYNTPNNTFLPRFGAAYRFDDHTVIRGGVGLFAGFLGQRRSDVLQAGYTRTTTLGTTTNANGASIPRLWDAFPTNITVLEPVGDAAGKQTGFGQGNIFFFNQNPKAPKQLRWQIGIQRELPWGVLFEAVYVGDYGYDLELIKDLNALPSKYLVDDAVILNGALDPNSDLAKRNAALSASVPNPFKGVDGFQGTTLYTSNTVQRNVILRAFPQYCSSTSSCGAGVITSNNDGKSWYHGGQFGLQRRFKNGNQIQLNYTWSKWLQATEYLSPGDDQPTKMISDQDVPHRLAVNGIYKLPFGRGQAWDIKNAWVNGFLGGWQLQGVYQFQVGVPVAFGSYSGLRFGQDAGTTSGDVIYLGGDPSLPSSEQTTDLWFNTAAFSTVNPTSAHHRTLPFRFTSVRRDNINNIDMSLMKYVNITESMRLQFRIDALNIANHAYFQAPSVALNNTMGTISQTTTNQANYPRRIQLGVKFIF